MDLVLRARGVIGSLSVGNLLEIRMSSGVSSVNFTDDLPDPEDEEFLVPGVEVLRC